MKKYRIINKKRFTFFIIFVFSIISLLSFVFISSFKAEGKTMEESYYEYYVKDGDTIWTIASKYLPKKYDIRKMVFEIRTLNELESSFIFPGEILLIPILD